jgi:hypothetical protein
MFSIPEVDAQLTAFVAKTREALNVAKTGFDRAMNGIPTGMPHPDGVLSIRNAGAAHTYALRAHTQALKEHRDFILDGLVPERFK